MKACAFTDLNLKYFVVEKVFSSREWVYLDTLEKFQHLEMLFEL